MAKSNRIRSSRTRSTASQPGSETASCEPGVKKRGRLTVEVPLAIPVAEFPAMFFGWNQGMVKNVADIYRLTAPQLMELERMGKKSAEKLIANIDASRRATLPRILNGVGIPFVGERT